MRTVKNSCYYLVDLYFCEQASADLFSLHKKSLVSPDASDYNAPVFAGAVCAR
jgi:hypothetical protein